jgi:hypothetical protein
MKDEEIDRLLKLAFLSGHTTELDNQLADSLLSEAEECLPDATIQLRRRFVTGILQKRHPRPIRQIDQKITFGTWLARERQSIGIEAAELANALTVTNEDFDRLEKSQLRPWEISVVLCSQIMRVMRLHYDALVNLVRTTASVSQMSGINAAQARCHSGKMTASRGDATARALELFMANNANPTRDSRAEEWLASLREHLEKDANSDLID